MLIHSASFVASAAELHQCPTPCFPEYAFCGRSNVGKSSLINSVLGRKGLAKTSRTPGKTKLINHFLINGNWYIADIPGYGFAKSSKKSRSAWLGLTENYILNRNNLLCLFVLVDSRHPPQQRDMIFMEWLGREKIPFVIAFTKTDKLSANQLSQNSAAYRKNMSAIWEELPQMFITSAITGLGRDAILGFIGETNKVFEKTR